MKTDLSSNPASLIDFKINQAKRERLAFKFFIIKKRPEAFQKASGRGP
jgi:hypothetical protein